MTATFRATARADLLKLSNMLQHEKQKGAVWKICKPPPDSNHAAEPGLAADAAAGSAGEAARSAPRAAGRPERANFESTDGGPAARTGAQGATIPPQSRRYLPTDRAGAASAAGRAPDPPRPAVSYTWPVTLGELPAFLAADAGPAR